MSYGRRLSNLPPGVTDADIERQANGPDDEFTVICDFCPHDLTNEFGLGEDRHWFTPSLNRILRACPCCVKNLDGKSEEEITAMLLKYEERQ